jgi:hypothetical protein
MNEKGPLGTVAPQAPGDAAEDRRRRHASAAAHGIRGKNGLKLIIYDGGGGLCAALRTLYFGAERQRCLFHKLRNLYNAIHVSEDLSAICSLLSLSIFTSTVPSSP